MKTFWERVDEAKADFINEESELLLSMYGDYARDMERYHGESKDLYESAHVNYTAIRRILLDRLEVK